MTLTLVIVAWLAVAYTLAWTLARANSRRPWEDRYAEEPDRQARPRGTR